MCSWGHANEDRPPLKRPRALVTGANGFTGAHMVEMLIDRGYDVVGIDVGREKAGCLAHLDFAYAPCDLRDPAATVRAVADHAPYDVIFHVAALIDLDAKYADLYDVNVVGTANLFDAFRYVSRRPKRVVFWSSAGVYGRAGEVFTEESPPDPVGGYPTTKYAAERTAFAAGARLGVEVTAIRPSGVYGPRNRSGFAVSIFTAARGGLGPIYAGSRATSVSMVHVADVCGAAEFLSRHPSAAREVYNLDDGSRYTSSELTRFIAASFGFSFLPGALPISLMRGFVKRLERKAGERGRVSNLNREMIDIVEHGLRVDASKIRALGWQPAHPDTKEGLRQTIAWYEKEGWL